MARQRIEKEQPAFDIQAMTTEEIQKAIAEVELQTKLLNLAEAKKRNQEFEDAERLRHEANKRRMEELTQSQAAQAATERKCRHRSGGKPGNILKGGGVGSFSIITRALMPDGVTVLLQCARCRMKRFPPEQRLKKEEPARYLKELDEYNQLLEAAIEADLEPLRGPTFVFTNAEGVPVIPQRV